ncbi:unnamed protein product [Ostreobium quekettii]|uniref:Uncharacterized protein n=1 Tax=Ostreobium quekettii TaxID=121088 RepID=A0A8S1IXQ2_9CHLO|nr:unnamed protein product [Ostreobium quekettii]
MMFCDHPLTGERLSTIEGVASRRWWGTWCRTLQLLQIRVSLVRIGMQCEIPLGGYTHHKSLSRCSSPLPVHRMLLNVEVWAVCPVPTHTVAPGAFARLLYVGLWSAECCKNCL